MTAIIKTEGIGYRKKGVSILGGIDWEVQPGEHWAIVGPNGSGKTTLLQLVNGYLWPNQGTISIFGQKLGTVDVRELRKKIGWVSSSILPMLRMEDESWRIVVTGKFGALAMYEEISTGDKEMAMRILAAHNSEQLAMKPFGLLSQGEKQRILISRALMAEPELLILDEPCTGLDLRAREDLLSYIQGMSNTSHAPTLVLVTHHTEEIVPSINKTLLLADGRVVAQGNKKDVLHSERLSQAYGLKIQLSWASGRPWTQVI
jgi:iron complex transport system ATP-binding protein